MCARCTHSVWQEASASTAGLTVRLLDSAIELRAEAPVASVDQWSSADVLAICVVGGGADDRGWLGERPAAAPAHSPASECLQGGALLTPSSSASEAIDVSGAGPTPAGPAGGSGRALASGALGSGALGSGALGIGALGSGCAAGRDGHRHYKGSGMAMPKHSSLCRVWYVLHRQ